MRLVTRTDETIEAIRDYFRFSIDDEAYYRDSAKMILDLLDGLQQKSPNLTVSVNRSLMRLVFVNTEKQQDVTVSAWDDVYSLSYSLHPFDSGWQDGALIGQTASQEQAMDLIIWALTRTNPPTQADYRHYLLHSSREWMEYVTQDTAFTIGYFTPSCAALGFHTDSLGLVFGERIPQGIFARETLVKSCTELMRELHNHNFPRPIRSYISPSDHFSCVRVSFEDNDELFIMVIIRESQYTIEYPGTKINSEWPGAKVQVHVYSVTDAVSVVAIGLH